MRKASLKEGLRREVVSEAPLEGEAKEGGRKGGPPKGQDLCVWS